MLGEHRPWREAFKQTGERPMRKEITFKQAYVRVMTGMPVISEETRNEHGHPVFRYFIPTPTDMRCERCGEWYREYEMHYAGATDTWRCDGCTEWRE
jgi:hypothetical protein